MPGTATTWGIVLTEAGMFIAAAGITDATQKSAITTLVNDLKAAGIWTGMKAIYPFVGGSATAHKYNLKDPRDINAAYRINFVGGWTHASTGATPNGTTGYADTFLPGSNLTTDSIHYSVYSRTGAISGAFDMGCLTGGIGPQMAVCSNILGGQQAWCDNTVTRVNVAVSDGLGLTTSSRTANTALNLYRNSSSIASSGAAEATPITNITHSFYIGARNNGGTAAGFSAREFSFATIGAGLSAANMTDWYTAVQAFQTTLGRNV